MPLFLWAVFVSWPSVVGRSAGFVPFFKPLHLLLVSGLTHVFGYAAPSVFVVLANLNQRSLVFFIGLHPFGIIYRLSPLLFWVDERALFFHFLLTLDKKFIPGFATVQELNGVKIA